MPANKRKSTSASVPAKKVLKTVKTTAKEKLDVVVPSASTASLKKDKEGTVTEILFSCEVCNETFVTKMSLTRHMFLHDDLPKFPCTFCKSTFYKKENLTNHIETDHDGAKFVCKYCDRNMTRRDLLLKHITNFHPEFLLETMQNEVQEKEKEVKEEKKNGSVMEFAKGGGRSKSKATPQTSKKSAEQCSDESYDSNTNAFDSGQEFDDEGDYDDATKINASLNGIRVERKFHCPECSASFISKVNLQRHLSTHSTDRPHKCEICSKGFVRKEHLTKHMSSVHSGMKFTCEFCGKDISRKDHLIRHIRNVHPTEFLGIPQEIIENEDMDLSLETIQTAGLVISERALKSMQPKPKKPYLSCDMCDIVFNTINELHEHQSAVHCDIRRFKCNFCPKAFKRKEHLVKHEILHTGEKNFCCDGCGKEFPRRDALQDHIRRVHGIDASSGNEYPCNFCEKVFLQRPNLIRHMEHAHDLKIDFEEEGELEMEEDMFSSNQGMGAYPILANFIVQPPHGSSSVDVSPIMYNGNGKQSTTFQADFNLPSFSCAHCKNAVFNDQKLFLAHLATHRLK